MTGDFGARSSGSPCLGHLSRKRVDDLGDGSTSYHTPNGRVEGTASGNNPGPGSAVWSGKVRAVDASDSLWTPVSGDARLEVDFGRTTIDIDFTNLEAGHGDMSWQVLRIQNGAFAHTTGERYPLRHVLRNPASRCGRHVPARRSPGRLRRRPSARRSTMTRVRSDDPILNYGNRQAPDLWLPSGPSQRLLSHRASFHPPML